MPEPRLSYPPPRLGWRHRTGRVSRRLTGPRRGHIAYRCDDIAAFKAHLEAKRIPYSDWGERAVNGWHQIFFYDPDGKVIEVHGLRSQ